MSDQPNPIRTSRVDSPSIIVLCLILVIGLFLRLPFHAFQDSPLRALSGIHPTPAFSGIGFDEGLYRGYVNVLIKGGLSSYPAIVEHYIQLQATLPGSILPPGRFLFIFSAYLWHVLVGTEALSALRDVASLFSILTLVMSSIIAWRLRGPSTALVVAALMSVAPTQLHMSQHALVDGFFTFWALLCLWALWENLQTPRNIIWLLLYALSLSLLVLTKENAFFVWIALVAIIVTNRWLHFGGVTRELILATLVGPLLGVAVLVWLAGGADVLFSMFQLSVSKNYQLQYAILTGDGPWHRYLIDLLIVSPIVLLLAVGAVIRLNTSKKPEIFVAVFIAASYLVMCNIKYGMNLRYANMWDMPLRLLAADQIMALAALAKRYRFWTAVAIVVAICLVEFRQYIVLCVNYPLYELVSDQLLRALRILKSR